MFGETHSGSPQLKAHVYIAIAVIMLHMFICAPVQAHMYTVVHVCVCVHVRVRA